MFQPAIMQREKELIVGMSTLFNLNVIVEKKIKYILLINKENSLVVKKKIMKKNGDFYFGHINSKASP